MEEPIISITCRSGIYTHGRRACVRTNRANELHFDACMFYSLSILRSNGDGTLDGLSVHIKRNSFPATLVELDVDGLALIAIFEDDVDVDRGGEEEGGHGSGKRDRTG